MKMPKWYPWFAWLACFLALIAGGAAAACPPSPQAWQPEIARLTADDSARPPPRHAVLFIGSSSIRMWTTLAKDFPGVPTIHRGFGGSAIADSTYYADRIVIPYEPRVIVMYAGDNDIAEGCTPEQVLGEFQAFVARVRTALPDVAIVYVSIKPSLARWALWPKMREANRDIARWAQTRQRMTFVDIATPMLGQDGKPRPALFRNDGLHMAPEGYAIWVAALKPVLAQYGFRTH